MPKLPLPIKIACLLVGLVFGTIILIYAKELLLPAIIAALLSLLLFPVYKRLIKWKVPNVLSVVITMLVVVVLIVVIAVIVSSQLKMLIADISSRSGTIDAKFATLQNYLSSHLNMDSATVGTYLAEGKEKLIGIGGNLASGAISTTTSFMGNLLLIIIYIFCFLLYNNSFRTFAFALLRTEKHEEATSLISHVQKLVQNYLVGLFTVILIIGTLNSIGLLIIGIPHAIFFAFFAGMLTVIPYIGISIGASLPVVYCLLTKDSLLPAVGVVAIMISVQFFESNFITPRIVGSKVSINPFVAIVVLLIGSELWGIPGMALSIPLTAILKLLLDSRPQTKPIGYFLGSELTDDKNDPAKFFAKVEQAEENTKQK